MSSRNNSGDDCPGTERGKWQEKRKGRGKEREIGYVGWKKRTKGTRRNIPLGRRMTLKKRKEKEKKQEWELTKEGNLKKFPLCATEVTVIVQSPRKNKKRRSH